MSNNWQKEELLLVLHFYCQTPFGKLHKGNPEIINLARILDRTPSAVAMKACNFASLDPSIEREGLNSTSKADQALWQEFSRNSSEIALAAEAMYEQKVLTSTDTKTTPVAEFEAPSGSTESLREVKTRRVQSFFRNSLLVSYENRCAISGLKQPQLLVASHIIPWKDSVERRADPTNGILLNSLYDKAFDRGYLTFDTNWRVTLSRDLKEHLKENNQGKHLFSIEGQYLIMPKRFLPDSIAMEYHRNSVFENSLAQG